LGGLGRLWGEAGDRRGLGKHQSVSSLALRPTWAERSFLGARHLQAF